MDTSVVIRTYTEARWDHLVGAVVSVQHQSLPPLQIIVVVDHNPDLLCCVKKRFPDITVVENHRARGSSGAWNSGIIAARGEIIAFLDDDAVAAADWLEHLNASYEAPEVVGVGGTIVPVWQGGRPPWFPEEFDWVVGCTYKGMPEAVAPVRNLIGCNMSLRREAFVAVGGFREGFGHTGGRPSGCEETDLCIRLRQYWPNKVLLHTPHAVVQHMVPADRATWRYFCWRCYLEGQSKALVTKFVGVNDGLASERSYALRTLPRGIMNGIGNAVLRRDLTGLQRAGAIATGLLITTAGYLTGIVSQQTAGISNAGQLPEIPYPLPTGEMNDDVLALCRDGKEAFDDEKIGLGS